MKYLLLIISFINITTLAQTKTTINLENFKFLEVDSNIEVVLEKSKENKLELTEKNNLPVSIYNKNNNLKISLPFSKENNKQRIKAKLFYKEDISKILATNNSIIKATNIEQQSIVCSVKEKGIIELNIKVNNVNINATSGGIVTLKGIANKQHVVLDLYGIYEGFELVVKESATVSVKSGAKAEIFTENLLTPTIGFGGSIFYKGNPTISDNKKINGGIIKKID